MKGGMHMIKLININPRKTELYKRRKQILTSGIPPMKEAHRIIENLPKEDRDEFYEKRLGFFERMQKKE